MRTFELLQAILIAIVCSFAINISVKKHWSPVVRTILTFIVPCLVFAGFSFYYVAAGENITDTIAKGIWCPIYSFATCPKRLSEASEEQAHWARIAAQEEAERKRSAEEAARKKTAEENAERKRDAEELAQKKVAEEEAERKRAAEEAALKKAAEEEAEQKRVAEEIARKVAAEEAEQKRNAEELARKKAVEEETERKRVAEEAARKVAAEESERKRNAEEFARKKAVEEETERKRMAEQAARKVAAEEAERKRNAEELARKKAVEEETERKRLAEEAARKKAAEDEAGRKRVAEEAARRKASEDEAERKRLAEEAARKKAVEEETERKRVAEEAARLREFDEIIASCSGCVDAAAKNGNEAYLMIVPVEPMISEMKNPYHNTSNAITLAAEDEVRQGVAKGYLRIFRGKYQFNLQRVSEDMYDEYETLEGISFYPQKRPKGPSKNFRVGFKVEDDEDVTWLDEEYYAIRAGTCAVLYAIFYPEGGNSE